MSRAQYRVGYEAAKKVGEESLKAAEKSLEIAREALKNENSTIRKLLTDGKFIKK